MSEKLIERFPQSIDNNVASMDSSAPVKRAREDDEHAVKAIATAAAEAIPEKKAKSSVEVSPDVASSIASLVGFYFGDANLRKDRFLKEEQVNSRAPCSYSATRPHH